MHSNITIGIFETAVIDDHLIKSHGTYSKMFIDMFHQQDPSVKFKFYDVIDDHYPESLDECDAYLITGSKADSFSDEPWVKKLRSYIPKIYQSHIPLVGICFGHQIIALALGGIAERSNKGWGVGSYQSQLVKQNQPTWLVGDHQDFTILVSHQDQVTTLPPKAKLLATNDFCINSAYYIDDKVLCFQGHPEISPAFARGLMELRKGVLPKDVFDKGQQTSEYPLNADWVTQWILAFIQTSGAATAS